MTVSRPGAAPRPAELLETPPPRRSVPSWVKVVGVIGALLALVALNAASAARDRAREQEANDRYDVRVSAGGAGTTYGDGLLQLTFAIDNRGKAVSFGDPIIEPSVFELLAGPAPNPVAPGGAGLFVLRLRPTCADVARLRTPFALRMLLPVIPPSGHPHVLPVQLDTQLMVDLATHSCGLVGPAEAAQPH